MVAKSVNLYDLQALAKMLGLYKGDVDGKNGPETKKALDLLTSDFPAAKGFPSERYLIAAVQSALNKLGYEAGSVDGFAGHNTLNALTAFQTKMQTGKDLVLPREPFNPPRIVNLKFPKQKDVAIFYGIPGPAIEKQLTTVPMPYKMVIDYDLKSTASKLRLHSKCIDSAVGAMNKIFAVYGQDKLDKLGLNRFAGSYMHRKMRGSKDTWSMHAYGCAIDFYAAPNGLTTRCPEALFCRPDYKDFFDIWEEFGWTSLGRAIGRDWMHVQAAYL